MGGDRNGGEACPGWSRGRKIAKNFWCTTNVCPFPMPSDQCILSPDDKCVLNDKTISKAETGAGAQNMHCALNLCTCQNDKVIWLANRFLVFFLQGSLSSSKRRDPPHADTPTPFPRQVPRWCGRTTDGSSLSAPNQHCRRWTITKADKPSVYKFLNACGIFFFLLCYNLCMFKKRKEKRKHVESH